jgi:hypothetical protein
MTGRRAPGVPWVGDRIHDAGTGRAAIVTDVQNGTYVLRPVHGGGAHWAVADPARLTITVTREQRRTEDRDRPGL